MKPGDIYVHKVSGQYVVILAKHDQGVSVRMARESKNEGTDYVLREFVEHELEPAKEHLVRELAEMELRREMLDAAEERVAQRKLDKLPAPKVATDVKVN